MRVTAEDGRVLAGAIGIGDGERAWRFTPDAPWPEAGIRIDVSPTLEDVAANNFIDLLDHQGGGATGVRSITLPIGLTACADQAKPGSASTWT